MLLIKRSTLNGISCTTYITTIRWHWVHWIIGEAIRIIFLRFSCGKCAISIQAIGRTSTVQVVTYQLCIFWWPGLCSLPFIRTHGVILHTRCCFFKVILCSFKPQVEPGIDLLIIIQTSIPNTALTNDRIFRSTRKTTMQGWSNHHVLIVTNLGIRCIGTYMIKQRNIWRDRYIIPGSKPEARYTKVHIIMV